LSISLFYYFKWTLFVNWFCFFDCSNLVFACKFFGLCLNYDRSDIRYEIDCRSMFIIRKFVMFRRKDTLLIWRLFLIEIFTRIDLEMAGHFWIIIVLLLLSIFFLLLADLVDVFASIFGRNWTCHWSWNWLIWF